MLLVSVSGDPGDELHAADATGALQNVLVECSFEAHSLVAALGVPLSGKAAKQ